MKDLKENSQKYGSFLRVHTCFVILGLQVGLQVSVAGAGTLVEDEGAALRLPLGRSVLGDPGMKSEKVRVAVEGWNFCNRVGIESPEAPSPRWADCTDINCEESDGTLPSPRIPRNLLNLLVS